MNHRTLFEITPPSRRATPDKVEEYTHKIAKVIRELPQIDLVNIPEIIDENHTGTPYYRNMEARDFGKKLEYHAGKPVMVNKVVVHEKNFPGWLKETREVYGITHLTLVGGTNEFVTYPGPSVTEADTMAVKAGFKVGNICIPNRPREEDRMLAKTAAGAGFFTTQVLYEGAAIQHLLRQYNNCCEKAEREPARVYLSFSPASDLEDLPFLKWLGVVIPPHVEEELIQKKELGQASIDHEKSVYEEIREFCEKENLKVPLGINVEQISRNNLVWACKLLASLGP